MRENTRVLTDVQDVTSDASIHMPVTSTPKKTPQRDVSRLGRSTYSGPAYSGPTYNTPLSKSLPAAMPTATFCGYPSEDEKDLV